MSSRLLNELPYYIIAFLAIVLMFLYHYTDDIKEKLEKARTEKALCEANSATLEGALKHQNYTIETQKINYEKRLKEYEQVVKTKPKVIKVKSNDCEDIKKSINTSVDFINSL